MPPNGRGPPQSQTPCHRYPRPTEDPAILANPRTAQPARAASHQDRCGAQAVPTFRAHAIDVIPHAKQSRAPDSSVGHVRWRQESGVPEEQLTAQAGWLDSGERSSDRTLSPAKTALPACQH